MNLTKRFTKYVSQNVMGMLGMSMYVLLDAFFIAQAGGANGITVLNLCLPIVTLVYGIGSMVGMGAATEYTILKEQGDEGSKTRFSNAIIWMLLISVVFMLLGFFAPGKVLEVMGGDAEIVAAGVSYMRIFLSCAPIFMINYVVAAFVRNDNGTTIAMIAMVVSTITCVISEYIFIFPMKMGLAGAALASVVIPVVSLLICTIHFFKKENTLQFKLTMPAIKPLFKACQLGFSAFVAEVSNGITIMVFNFLILAIAGNIGVAAYGIVANIAIVANAIYNGIAQGSQPLLSECYGKNEPKNVKKLLIMGVVTSLVISAVFYGLIFGFTDLWISIFNSENSVELAGYAFSGLRLYFLGCFFAGFNIVAAGCLGAIEQAKAAFIASTLRGFVAISAFACLLAFLFGFTGIWLAFLAAEAFTSIFAIYFLARFVWKRGK